MKLADTVWRAPFQAPRLPPLVPPAALSPVCRPPLAQPARAPPTIWRQAWRSGPRGRRRKCSKEGGGACALKAVKACWYEWAMTHAPCRFLLTGPSLPLQSNPRPPFPSRSGGPERACSESSRRGPGPMPGQRTSYWQSQPDSPRRRTLARSRACSSSQQADALASRARCVVDLRRLLFGKTRTPGTQSSESQVSEAGLRRSRLTGSWLTSPGRCNMCR